ncbi:MAG: LamG-like jellyroll fold domain-containing protein [Verrucomicrobiota bacterium]
MPDKELHYLIQAHLDQHLDDEDFSALERLLESDPNARLEYAEMARLDAALRDAGENLEPANVLAFENPAPRHSSSRKWLAVAALVALLIIPSVFLLKQNNGSTETASTLAATKGIAVITAEAEAVWAGENADTIGEGVALEPGTLTLKEGLAQIDFFGGASVSLVGPAKIELVNRDAAVLHQGKLRADVPPAARGFEIRTRDVLLEDLGTSFGLSAGTDDTAAGLIVFDGEVRATGKDGSPILLNGGETVRLEEGAVIPDPTDDLGEFPDITDVIAGSGTHEEVRYAAWREASLDRRRDDRLIAYYDFEGLTAATRRLRNQALHGMGSELDGGIVGARVAQGRWGQKNALDFRSEGDRIRFDIPGEYDAITLYAWVRIDALDRHLNSLFLTDFFDENEVHWQLSDEGHMHFAVSPMGAVDIPEHNRRFYSERFWNPSKSGQWFLLAVTAEKGVGTVNFYVNGEPIEINDGTQMQKPVPAMRFGEVDLGNWSEPIWERAIRTLNGRIDEFAIYSVALPAEEIKLIYEEGRP